MDDQTENNHDSADRQSDVVPSTTFETKKAVPAPATVKPTGHEWENDETTTGYVTTDQLEGGTSQADINQWPEYVKTVSRKPPLGHLEIGHVLCGDYIVVDTIKPHLLDDCGVFICDGPDGRVVVKVHAVRFPPDADLWARLGSLIHPNVVRTLRTIPDPDGFYYEIQEYCDRGSLNQYCKHLRDHSGIDIGDLVSAKLVPQVVEGLNYLHENHIVHRDINPSNIYVKSGTSGDTFAVGDFDISLSLESDDTSRYTEHFGGTWDFTAPEAFPGFTDDYGSGRQSLLTRSADYYSLGLVIIVSIVGQLSFSLHSLTDMMRFYMRGDRVQTPTSISDRLSVLIKGLLIRDYRKRWGYVEVSRWLRQEDPTPDELQRISDDDIYEVASFSKPYAIAGNPVNLAGLARAMFEDPATATEDLLEGNVLIDWIGKRDTGIAREVRRARDELRSQPELALFVAMMRCDPSQGYPLPNGERALSTGAWCSSAELIHPVTADNASASDLTSDSSLAKLEAWLRLKSNPEPLVADAIVAIRQSGHNFRLAEILYCLQPNRSLQIARDRTASTLEEYVDQTYGSPDDWRDGVPTFYSESLRLWRSGHIAAWLRQRGYKDIADNDERVRSSAITSESLAFQALLRRLRPESDIIEIDVDTSRGRCDRTLAFGEKAQYSLPYTSSGCGVPYGVLVLDTRHPGLSLDQSTISERTGTISVSLDSTNEIPVSTNWQAKLTLRSEGAKMMPTPIVISYQVTLPIRTTFVRVAVGAAIGAVLFGGVRATLSALGMRHVQRPSGFDTSLAWSQTLQRHYPYSQVICGGIIVASAIVGGLYLWLYIVRRYAVK